MTEDRKKLRVLNLERELERLSEENDNVMILNKSLKDDIKDLKKDNEILARQVDETDKRIKELDNSFFLQYILPQLLYSQLNILLIHNLHLLDEYVHLRPYKRYMIYYYILLSSSLSFSIKYCNLNFTESDVSPSKPKPVLQGLQIQPLNLTVL